MRRNGRVLHSATGESSHGALVHVCCMLRASFPSASHWPTGSASKAWISREYSQVQQGFLVSRKASFHMSFLIALSSAVFGFSFSFLLSWKRKFLGAEQVSVATDPLAVHMPHLQLPSRTQQTVPKETVRSVRQNKKQKPRGNSMHETSN